MHMSHKIARPNTFCTVCIVVVWNTFLAARSVDSWLHVAGRLRVRRTHPQLSALQPSITRQHAMPLRARLQVCRNLDCTVQAVNKQKPHGSTPKIETTFILSFQMWLAWRCTDCTTQSASIATGPPRCGCVLPWQVCTGAAPSGTAADQLCTHTKTNWTNSRGLSCQILLNGQSQSELHRICFGPSPQDAEDEDFKLSWHTIISYCMDVYLSIYLYLYISIYLYIYISIYLYIYISISIYLYI